MRSSGSQTMVFIVHSIKRSISISTFPLNLLVPKFHRGNMITPDGCCYASNGFASQLRNNDLENPLLLEQPVSKPALCPRNERDISVFFNLEKQS